MTKRKCLKCGKMKTFSKGMQNSLVCRWCVPSKEAIEKGNEVLIERFSKLRDYASKANSGTMLLD